MSLSQASDLPESSINRKAKAQRQKAYGEFLHFQPSGPVFVISRGHSQEALLLWPVKEGSRQGVRQAIKYFSL